MQDIVAMESQTVNDRALYERFSVRNSSSGGFGISTNSTPDPESISAGYEQYKLHSLYIHYRNIFEVVQTFSPNVARVYDSSKKQTVLCNGRGSVALTAVLVGGDVPVRIVLFPRLSAELFNRNILRSLAEQGKTSRGGCD